MTDTADAFLYRRPELARQYADALLGRSPFGHRSGLFLAAPRRTGKSTFLRIDLVPCLEAEGVRTLYVDLWADRTADPGQLIAARLARELEALASPLSKLLRKSGVRRVSGGGVALDFSEDEASEPVTFTDALREIAKRSGKPVALIVDEAQHALDSEAGKQAMFALKAARDALNQEGQGETRSPGLILVMTGSHRDKLSALVLNRDQPFFGATVVDFPLLGDGYVAAYVDWLNARLAPDNRFDTGDVTRAFRLLGHRPELLDRVLSEHALGGAGAPGLRTTVETGAEQLRERLWTQYDNDFGALTPLQRALLMALLREGERLAPFTEATRTALEEDIDARVTASDIQKALKALRRNGLVWKSGRGTYAAEDQGMIAWLEARSSEN